MTKHKSNFARDPATKSFSILNMKDDYEDAFETLVKAMMAQNPGIDADAFDLKLRQVISSFGNPNPYGMDAFASLAEEHPVPTIYSASGDLLSMAYEAHLSGDKKQALDIIESAFGENDIETLIDAIQINNKRSAIGVLSDESDENADADKSSTTDEDEDNTELVDLPDDDDDQSDGLNDDKPTDDEVAVVKSKFNSALSFLRSEADDESTKEKSDEKPEDKTPKADPKKPMATPDATGDDKGEKSESAAVVRATANRLSLNGSKQSRKTAHDFRVKMLKK